MASVMRQPTRREFLKLCFSHNCSDCRARIFCAWPRRDMRHDADASSSARIGDNGILAYDWDPETADADGGGRGREGSESCVAGVLARATTSSFPPRNSIRSTASQPAKWRAFAWRRTGRCSRFRRAIRREREPATWPWTRRGACCLPPTTRARARPASALKTAS